MAKRARQLVNKIVLCLIVFAVACAPHPIEDIPDPTPTQKALQDAPKTINPNPGLVLGECRNKWFDDGFWGIIHVEQCTPDHYTLYQIWQTVDGNTDNHQEFITTNPMAITHETGLSYTVYPGGRAGRIGFTSEIIEFDPGCYGLKMFGEAILWGKPLEYTIRALVSNGEIGFNKAPSFGEFEIALFWLAETQTTAPVTIFLQFDYGSPDAKSRVNISRLEVLLVSLPHCG